MGLKTVLGATLVLAVQGCGRFGYEPMPQGVDGSVGRPGVAADFEATESIADSGGSPSVASDQDLALDGGFTQTSEEAATPGIVASADSGAASEASPDSGAPVADPGPVASCFDETQNQGETGVDCGGSCDACSLGAGTCSAVTNGNDYLFCDDALSWNAARIDCLARGMRLARIDDSAEDSWIQVTSLLEYGLSSLNLWVAGTDRGVEGQWRWQGGQLFWQGDASGAPVASAFANWALNEPNDSEGENCMTKVIRLLDPQGWNDQPCEEAQVYLCEDY